MRLLKTIYEEAPPPTIVSSKKRRQRLKEAKYNRKIAKQLEISIACAKSPNSLIFPGKTNLETIFEEEGQQQRRQKPPTKRTDNFKKLFLGWLKFNRLRPIKYNFPSIATQEATGYGSCCARCYRDFVHDDAFSLASPVYITVCGHIVCALCISHKSRQRIPNLNPMTLHQFPYTINNSYDVTACPACNVEFDWNEVYNFYS